MAGFAMPKKGEGAAMLRDLRDEERPTREEDLPPVLTEVRTPVLTDVREDAGTEGSTDVREEASKPASTHASEEGSTPARTEARPPASPQALTQARKTVRKAGSKPAGPHISKGGSVDKSGGVDAADFLGAVDAALASREPLTGGVKATVDMSPELSTRAKRYLADHRGSSTRQVLIALFDAFLTAKGY